MSTGLIVNDSFGQYANGNLIGASGSAWVTNEYGDPTPTVASGVCIVPSNSIGGGASLRNVLPGGTAPSFAAFHQLIVFNLNNNSNSDSFIGFEIGDGSSSNQGIEVSYVPTYGAKSISVTDLTGPNPSTATDLTYTDDFTMEGVYDGTAYSVYLNGTLIKTLAHAVVAPLLGSFANSVNLSGLSTTGQPTMQIKLVQVALAVTPPIYGLRISNSTATTATLTWGGETGWEPSYDNASYLIQVNGVPVDAVNAGTFTYVVTGITTANANTLEVIPVFGNSLGYGQTVTTPVRSSNSQIRNRLGLERNRSMR